MSTEIFGENSLDSSQILKLIKSNSRQNSESYRLSDLFLKNRIKSGHDMFKA